MADSTYTLTIVVQGQDQASGPIHVIVDNLNQVGQAASQAAAPAEGFFSRMAAAAGGFLAANVFGQITQGITSFAAGTISAAADFQTGMSVLQQASHATDTELEQMRSLAIALGNDMQLPGASAQDAATAMVELAKAGLNVNDTMAAAKGTLQLAAAAETDAGTAAQVVAGALNAFGLEGAQAAHVVDLLAGAAGASSANITDMSQGFNQAGFAFHAAGATADDLAAALAILTKTGLSGADSGTALKNAMIAMMAPTSAAAGAMQQYGINVRDGAGNMLPFRDIIGVLQEKLGGLSPAARDAALHTILMSDGMKAMLPLLNAGVSGFDAMKETVGQAGSAQAQAAAQMVGFNGAMGGLSNAVETLQLIIGGALLPVLTDFLNIISGAVGFVSTFVSALEGSTDAFAQLSPAMQYAVAGLQMIGQFFADLANQALAWGSNIVNQLAAGMMDAIGGIISIINQIGSVIASLLAPGSPPAFLPELTNWGTGAINAYMEGWGQADFSVFNSIGDGIKSALEGIAKATGDKGMNVASLVMGSQDEIAQAISEVRNLGSVSEATFNSIISAAGPAGPQVSGLVHAYLDLEAATQNVAAAQTELNSITDEYASKLAPLNAQLKSIQDQKQAIQDAQKLAKLQAEIADAGTSDAQRQIDMLEIQELQTRQQIRATEDERDAAVGAAKDKLDAAKAQQSVAKAQVDQQKALLDAQNKTNALIAEQTKAMTSVAGAMHVAGAAAASHASAQGGLSQALATVSHATETVSQVTQNAGHTLAAAGATIGTVGATIGTVGASIRDSLAPAFAFVQQNATAFIGALAGIGAVLLAPTVWGAIASAIGLVGSALGVVGGVIAFILSPLGLLIIAAGALGAAIATNFMGITDLLSGIANEVAAFAVSLYGAIQGIAAAFNSAGSLSIGFAVALEQLGSVLGLPAGLLSSISFAVQDFATQLYAGGQAIASFVTGGTGFTQMAITLIGLFGPTLGGIIAQTVGVLDSFAQVWIDLGMTIGSVAGALMSGDFAGAWQALTSGLAQVGTDIQAFTQNLGSLLAQFGQIIINAIVTYTPLIIAQLLSWGAAFVDWISPYAALALAALSGFVAQLWGWVVAQAPGFVTQLLSWGQAFIGWIAPYVPVVLGALGGLVGMIGGWVIAQVPVLIAQLLSWGQALAGWVAPAIPIVLGALGGLLASAWGWVVAQAPGWVTQLLTWGQALANWVLPAIPLVLVALGGLATQLFAWVSAQVQPLLVQFGQWAGALIAWIVPATTQFLQQWPGMLNSFLDWIGGAVGPILAQLGQWAIAFISWIGPALPGVLGGLAGIGLAVGAFIVETAGVLALKVIQWGAAFIGWIATEVLPKLPGGLAGIATTVITFITTTTADLAPKVAAWAGAFLTWIATDVVPKLPGELAKIAVAVFTFITTTVGEIAPKVAAWAIAFVGWIATDVLPKLPGELAKIIVAIGTWTGTAIINVTTWMAGLAVKFVTWVATDVVPKLPGALATINTTIGGWILSAAGWAAGEIVKLAAALYEWVAKDVVPKLPGALQAVNDAISGWVSGAVGWVAGQAASLGKSIVDGIIKGVASAAGGLFNSLKDLAMSALGAAQGAIDAHSPSQLFADLVGAPIVAGIAMGIQNASPQAVDAMLDLASKLVDVVSKGVDAFGKLQQLGTIPMSSIQQFADMLFGALTIFGDITTQWDRGMMSAASQFTDKANQVVETMTKGVDFLLKLQGLGPIPVATIHGFAENLNLAMLDIVRISTVEMRMGLSAAVVFAESAGKVIAVIGTAVDAFVKLRDFQLLPRTVFSGFAYNLLIAIQNFINAANAFSTDMLSVASRFATTAKTVLDTIAAGVTAFEGLRTYQLIPAARFSEFAYNLLVAMQNFTNAANAFSVEGLAQAARFAATVGQILTVISSGVDAFDKLRDYALIPAARFSEFAYNLLVAVQNFMNVVDAFSADALAAASAFAASAGNILSIIVSGVEALDKLRAFQSVPVIAIQSFGVALTQVVATMVAVALRFTTTALAAAAAFADGAGKVVGLIGAGVEGFTKLATFQGVPIEAIDAFTQTMLLVVQRIAWLSIQWVPQMVAAAGVFAENVGKIIGIIGAGVEGFIKLADFQGVPAEAVDAFTQALLLTVQRIAWLSLQWAPQMIATAATFAEGAGRAIAIIGAGADGFARLQDFAGVPAAALNAFGAALRDAIAVVIAIAASFAADGVAAASAFATSVGAIVGIIQTGTQAFVTLQELRTIPQVAMAAFADGLRQVTATMIALAQQFGASGLAAATAFRCRRGQHRQDAQGRGRWP
jgi:TP901 family phage tail tape measure protein